MQHKYFPLFFLVFTLCFSAWSTAQIPFSFTQGGTSWDEPYDVVATPDSGWICVGGTYSFGNGSSDFYVIKFDQAGTEQWKGSYGTGQMDIPTSVAVHPTGGYWLLGETQSGATGKDWVLLQLDDQGAVLASLIIGWESTDYAASVLPLADGGVILTGSIRAEGTAQLQACIMRLDDQLNTVWKRAYGYGNDRVFQALLASDGGVVLVGETAGEHLLWKLDSNGDLQWDFSCKIEGHDSRGMSLAETADSGFVAAGYFTTVNDEHIGFLRKVDKDGWEQWIRTYSGLYEVELHDVNRVGDSVLLAAGTVESTGTGNRDLLYMELDMEGELLRTFSIGGEQEEGFALGQNHVAVCELIHGNRVIVGGTESFGSGDSDFYITLFDPQQIDSICNSDQPGIEVSAALLCWGNSGASLDTIGTIEETNWSAESLTDLYDTLCGTAPPPPPVDTTTDPVDTSLFVTTLPTESSQVLYPNPATDRLQVSPVIGKKHRFTAHSMLGQAFVLKRVPHMENTLDVSALPPGVYYLFDAELGHLGTFVKQE